MNSFQETGRSSALAQVLLQVLGCRRPSPLPLHSSLAPAPSAWRSSCAMAQELPLWHTPTELVRTRISSTRTLLWIWVLPQMASFLRACFPHAFGTVRSTTTLFPSLPAWLHWDLVSSHCFGGDGQRPSNWLNRNLNRPAENSAGRFVLYATGTGLISSNCKSGYNKFSRREVGFGCRRSVFAAEYRSINRQT